ncbi:hypothetical protein Z043_121781 [Scleropages formosus]|uniref:RING-type domain-containing protein n=1 Tax=Scleropages formosus TaxID=113540 RepID=A0A0P7U0X9_SCLFO|nr:hypothetical protein Z043_121781 [Scleropages formosus]
METEKCPSCSGILKPCLDRVGQPLLYTQCSLMPESHQFCRSCLAPWKPIHEDGIESCSNRSCEVVSVLITCDKCPSCSGILKPCLDRVGQPLLYTQCSLMPESHQFCRSCLAPWKPIHEDGIESCSNRSCEVVSVLITCDKVTDPKSKVLGCPLFRACPKCYSLIMVVDGCKYVQCKKCKHRFCFICLERSEDCRQDRDLYWSLTCRKPRAGIQWFVT